MLNPLALFHSTSDGLRVTKSTPDRARFRQSLEPKQDFGAWTVLGWATTMHTTGGVGFVSKGQCRKIRFTQLCSPHFQTHTDQRGEIRSITPTMNAAWRVPHPAVDWPNRTCSAFYLLYFLAEGKQV